LRPQGPLKGDGVHYRGEHAHVIGVGPVEPLRRSGQAAKDVAAADDQADLAAAADHFGDFAGQPGTIAMSMPNPARPSGPRPTA
jgi:hypothetical protein